VLLSSQPLPQGRRVAVLTNAGGLGILCADACSAAGLELPTLADETGARLAEILPREASLANPVDMLGSAVGSTYEAVLPHVLADPGIDAVIVLFVPPVVAGAEEVAEAVVRGVERGAQPDKPVLAAFISDEGFPVAAPARLGCGGLRVSGVGGPGAGARRRPRRVAAPAGRRAARARRRRPPAAEALVASCSGPG
jgi:acyl-CoA synthetase (NDP forming)